MDAYRVAYPIAKVVVGTFLTLGGGFRVEGAENVPLRGGMLLTPNHLSDCDPPVIGAAAPRPLWFMAKQELFAIPILAPIIRFWRAFPVKRGSADRQAIRYVEQLLNAGEGVVIFPEGRVSPDGKPQPFQSGVALLALRTGKPIVPVYVEGTNHVLPYGSLIPRPSFRRTLVRFGKPLTFADVPRGVRRSEQVEVVMARLQQATEELRNQQDEG